MHAHFSTHLINSINKTKVKNPMVKLYKQCLEVYVSKTVFSTRSETTMGPCKKDKEIFKFYDGSAIGFFFENSQPIRVEDYLC